MLPQYFIITATMYNGDRWETRRETFAGMQRVVQDILKDKDIQKFSVEEKQ